jgi:hypothetical protein
VNLTALPPVTECRKKKSPAEYARGKLHSPLNGGKGGQVP